MIIEPKYSHLLARVNCQVTAEFNTEHDRIKFENECFKLNRNDINIILNDICTYFDVSKEYLLSRRKEATIVNCRIVFAVLTDGRLTLSACAKYLGLISHATIRYHRVNFNTNSMGVPKLVNDFLKWRENK